MPDYGDEYDDLRDDEDDEYYDEADDPDEEVDDDEDAPPRVNPFTTRPGAGLPGAGRSTSVYGGSGTQRPSIPTSGNRPAGTNPPPGSASGVRPYGSSTPATPSSTSGSGSGAPGGNRPTYGSGSSGSGPGSPSGNSPTTPGGNRPTYGSGSSGSGPGSPSGNSPTTPSGNRPTYGSGSSPGSSSTGTSGGNRPTYGSPSTPSSSSSGSGTPAGNRPTYGSGSSPGSSTTPPPNRTPYGSSSTPSASSSGTPARPYGAGSTTPTSTPPKKEEPKKDEKAAGGLAGRFGGITSRIGGGEKKDDKKPDAKPGDSGKGGIGGLLNRGAAATPAKPGEKKDDKPASGGLAGRLGGITSRFGGEKKDDKKPETKPGTPSSSYPSSTTSSSSPYGSRPPTSTTPPPGGYKPGGTSSTPASSTYGSKPFGAAGGAAVPGVGAPKPGTAPGAKPGAPAPEKKGLLAALPFGRGKEEKKPAAKPRVSKAPKVEQNQGLTLDTKLDILGIGLFLGALMLVFSSISANKGALTEQLNGALGQLFGWGAIAVPIAMAGVGMWLFARRFGDEPPTVQPLRVIGAVVLYVGLLIALQFMDSLSYTAANGREVKNLIDLKNQLQVSWQAFHTGGGWIGVQLYYVLVVNLSEIGAFFVTIGWLIIGIMLTADISFYELSVFLISAARSFRDARARRSQARTAQLAAKALAAQQAAPQISVSAPAPEQLPAPAAAALPAVSAPVAAPALPEPPKAPERNIPITIGGRTITAFNSDEMATSETGPAIPIAPPPVSVPRESVPAAAPAKPEETGRGGLGGRLGGLRLPIGGNKEPAKAEPEKPAVAPAASAAPAAAPAKPEETGRGGLGGRLGGLRLPIGGNKEPAKAEPEKPAVAAAEMPKVAPPPARPVATPVTASATPAAAPGQPPTSAPTRPEEANRWMRPGNQPAPTSTKPAEEPAARLGDLVRPPAPKPAAPAAAEEPAARLGDLVRPPAAASATGATRATPTVEPAKPAGADKLAFGIRSPLNEPAKPTAENKPPLSVGKPFVEPEIDDEDLDEDDELTESEELRNLPPAKPKGFVEPPPRAEENKTRFGVSVFGTPRSTPAPVPPRPEARPEPETETPPLAERMSRLNAIRAGNLTPAEKNEGDKAAMPSAKPETPAAAPAASRPAAPVSSTKPEDMIPGGSAKPVSKDAPPWDTGEKPAASTPAATPVRPGETATPRPPGVQPFNRPQTVTPFNRPGDGTPPKDEPKPADQRPAASIAGMQPTNGGQADGGARPAATPPTPARPSYNIPPSTPPVAPARPTPVIQHPGAQAVPQPANPPPFSSAPPRRRIDWKLPNLSNLLRPGSEQDFDREQLLARARNIEDTLSSFGAPGKVVEVNTGPVITQFAVEPDYLTSRGGKKSRVKVSAIAQLDKDLQLALGAKSIRIEAPVPGKGYVGIEVPNEAPALVSLRDVMDSDEFRDIDSPLAIALGQSVDGTPVAADLGSMPHLLIAGTTGSGKSVCVNAIIASLLLRNPPDVLKFIMVDPKRVELTGYNGIPHLVAPVVVDLERIVGVLKWVTREMDERYKRFSNAGARNIEDFNKHLPATEEVMPYIVVIIDELADLMMLAPDETERVITRIAALARATGIHLVIATQRPSVDVVTGLIKANFPARIAFAVASSVDSRVIIDQPGADRLLGRGDMLYMSGDSPAPLRLQGVYVSDTEINNINHYWKTLVGEEGVAARPITQLVLDHTVAETSRPVMPSNERQQLQQAFWDRDEERPQPGFMGLGSSNQDDDDDDVNDGDEDELYEEAVEMVRRLNKASVSLLQRRLRIGYTRAARLIDLMEERGVVGPAESGSKPREVLPLKGAAP